MVLILEDFPKFIAETLNSFFSKLVNKYDVIFHEILSNASVVIPAT
jgi:hypothetical protein